MEKNFSRTLVTAALPYANGGVHIGHLAGVYVPADIYVRYLRLKGREVLFICGSEKVSQISEISPGAKNASINSMRVRRKATFGNPVSVAYLAPFQSRAPLISTPI